MPELRTFICDVCGEEYQEPKFGGGAPGWGQLKGIDLDGVPNPYLCPTHLAILSEQLDRMKQMVHEGKR